MKVSQDVFSDSDLPRLILLTLLPHRRLPKRKIIKRKFKSFSIFLILSHPCSFLVYGYYSYVFLLQVLITVKTRV